MVGGLGRDEEIPGSCLEGRRARERAARVRKDTLGAGVEKEAILQVRGAAARCPTQVGRGARSRQVDQLFREHVNWGRDS